MPSIIIGANCFVTTRKDFISGTNGPLIKQLLGGKIAEPKLGSTVSIDDVAKLHVLALKSSVPVGKYLVGLDRDGWVDANTIVKKDFSEEIGKSLSAEGEAAKMTIKVHGAKTEKAPGSSSRALTLRSR